MSDTLEGPGPSGSVGWTGHSCFGILEAQSRIVWIQKRQTIYTMELLCLVSIFRHQYRVRKIN